MSLDTMKLPALLTLAALAAGCVSPLHLTYDFGRAYTESVLAQADLTRPSVAEAQYALYGQEAANIRLRVQEETTDAESGETELTTDSN